MTLKSGRRRSGLGTKKVAVSSPRRSPVKRRRSGALSGPSVSGISCSSSSLPDGSSSGSSSAATNIKVSVRVRPPNSSEVSQDVESSSFRSLIQVVDDKLLIFDPKEGTQDFYFHGKVQRRRDLNKRPQKDHKFTFDRVFSPQESNRDIFESTTLDLVDALFSGYNSSVFVYGATGAGKTYTMLGSEGNPGITYRTVEAIYERIQSSADELSCEVSISYLEIYNENVVDLINPGSLTLNIREDGQNGVNIPGLTRHKPKTPEELLKLLKHGNSNRSQHPTDANAESSRSHAVFQVFLTQKDRSAGLTADVKVAKLSLIDLAGSERGTVTSSRGAARKKEGANINKSLLALGNCINALAEGSKYIPFRNSKLTRLLKDSLGGNCRTVMISNVSPSNKTYEDTYNTLKYAERAKKIKVKLKKNIMSVDFHVAQYAKIVENLKQEISELKEKIRLGETSKEEGGGGGSVTFLESERASVKEEIESLRKENATLKENGGIGSVDITNGVAFQEIKILFTKRLELQSQMKLNQVRMIHCQTIIDRTKTISELFHITEVFNASKNCLKTLKGLESLVEDLKREKVDADKKYLEAKNKFDIETSSMKLKQDYTSQLETLESHMNSQHLSKFSRLVASERRKDNYLIGLFLPNLIASNLELNSLDGSKQENIMNIIDYFCGKKVSWDEDLIESSNLDSSDQLMGRLYSDNVSIESSMQNELEEEECEKKEKEVINDDHELSDSGEASVNTAECAAYVPTPLEKEKHAKILTPTSIFEMSLEEEEEEEEKEKEQPSDELPSNSPMTLPSDTNNSPPLPDLNATQTLCSSQPIDPMTVDPIVVSPPIKVDLNSTQTLQHGGLDLNSTHTVADPCGDLYRKENVLSMTHTMDPRPNVPASSPSPLKLKRPVQPHPTSTTSSSSNEDMSKSIRRETYSLVKPTVAVQPISQSLKIEKISPMVTLTENTHGRPFSRTPPAMGTSQPRRKLNSSKSTSRLLTSADVRFGSSNGNNFGRPQTNPSASSAPSYMASTAASSNKLTKQKENMRPPANPSSTEAPKMSFMRQIKRTLPKKTS